MLSKFLQPCVRLLCARTPKHQAVRKSQLIPASQYDDKGMPLKFQMSHVLKIYWELIPLFFVTGLAFFCLFASIVSACNNKVDAVFSTYSRRNISRTMNLRAPTVHKLRLINQRYEPWPEMQDVLDKMKQQEKNLKIKMEMCSQKSNASG